MSVQVDSPVPLTYSLREAAELLGVTRRTLSQSIKRGEIPAIRIGARVLVSRAGLAEMLAPGGRRS